MDREKEYFYQGMPAQFRTNHLMQNISVMPKIIFDKISSEDALNIINSKFNIYNIEFIENASDAMDFDFSDGKIDKVKFLNIGNDAIDFSGSNANISNISFENVSDKLISVGENSNVKILMFNLNIFDIHYSKNL